MTLLVGKTKSRSSVSSAAAAAVLVLGVVAVGLSSVACNKVEGKSKGNEEVVIPVAVEEAKPGTINEEVFLSGDVHADVEVKVLSLVPERILKLKFEEGDKVEKGQLLATVKAGALYDVVRGAKAGLRAAKTQLRLSKIELQRTRKLRKTGTVPLANLQRAEAQYNSAKAQLAQAQAMLSQSYSNISNVNVRAPVSGIIGQRFLNKGDVAGPSVPLCTIVQLDPVRIKASATEFDLVKLKKGQPAVITVPAYPEKKWEGKVDYLSPVLDRATRSALVTVVVKNDDKTLRPGMFADVVVKTGKRENVITVPARAIRRRVLTGGEVAYSVFLAKGNEAKRQRVKIGVRKKDRIEIKSGLKPGDPVVVLGNHRLKDGTKIKIGENLLKKNEAATSSSPREARGSEKTPRQESSEPRDGSQGKGASSGSSSMSAEDPKSSAKTSSGEKPRSSRPRGGAQK